MDALPDSSLCSFGRTRRWLTNYLLCRRLRSLNGALHSAIGCDQYLHRTLSYLSYVIVAKSQVISILCYPLQDHQWNSFEFSGLYHSAVPIAYERQPIGAMNYSVPTFDFHYSQLIQHQPFTSNSFNVHCF